MRVSSTTVGGSELGVVTSADPYITTFVGPYADLRGCVSCEPSILDRAYRQDLTGLPLAKEMGYIMGISRLADAKPTDKPNVVVARATNLSSLTSALLLRTAPEGRQAILDAYGGVMWSAKVTAFASKMPGVIGISDGVRFALAMYFLVGISDTERGKDTEDARAYKNFARLFKTAEAELSGKRDTSLNGLGSLGQAKPASTYEKCEWYDAACHARNAAKAVMGAADATAKAVVSTVKAAGEGIQKAADWGTDILCKGLKGLLGEAIGGAICWVITKGIQIFVSAAKALVEIVGAAITGLIDFVKFLGQGKVMEAIKALMTAVTKMLFLLFLPISEPFMGVKAEKLKEIGEKVAKRNPFFPLSLVFGIIGVLKPDVTSISTLILALSPAVAVMIAPPFTGLLKLTVEKCEDAVEKFIKLALIIFQGAMALADILPRLKTSVEAFLKKRGGVGKAIADQSNKVMDGLRKSWDKITAAFGKFKLNEVSTALSAMFSLIPEILGGLLEDVKNEIPEIGEAIKAVQDAPKSIAEREAALQKFNEDALKAMGVERRKVVVSEQALQLPQKEAGILTGRMLYEKWSKAATETEKKAYENATKEEFMRLRAAGG